MRRARQLVSATLACSLYSEHSPDVIGNAFIVGFYADRIITVN